MKLRSSGCSGISRYGADVFLAVALLFVVARLGLMSEELWNVLMERPQFPSCDDHLIPHKYIKSERTKEKGLKEPLKKEKEQL